MTVFFQHYEKYCKKTMRVDRLCYINTVLSWLINIIVKLCFRILWKHSKNYEFSLCKTIHIKVLNINMNCKKTKEKNLTVFYHHYSKYWWCFFSAMFAHMLLSRNDPFFPRDLKALLCLTDSGAFPSYTETPGEKYFEDSILSVKNKLLLIKTL